MSVLPKLIYRFHVITIKIQAGFFIDLNKFILKCVREGKDTRIVKTILKKKNKAEGFTLC